MLLKICDKILGKFLGKTLLNQTIQMDIIIIKNDDVIR